MIIKCGACGNDMELDTAISDGQRISCPFCGEKTVYRKPTRIEIPVNVSSIGRKKPTEQASKSEDSPQEAGKPRLGIRRPKGASASADLNALSIMKKMEDDERERAAAEEKAARATRRARREMVVRYSIIAVVVLACVGVASLWFKKRHEERMKRAAVIQEQIRAEREAEKARQEEELAEKARREQQAKDEQETRRKQSEEERRHRAEAAEKKRMEEDARQRALQVEVERYRLAVSKFRNVLLLPYRSLPKNARPGAAEGLFYFAVPAPGGVLEIYEVSSGTNSQMTATMLSPRGDTVEIDYSAFMEKVKASGGVLHNDRMAYLICPVDGGKGVPLPSLDINPARVRTGALNDVVKSMSMSTGKIVFEVKVELPGWKKPVFARSVAYGDVVSMSEVDGALRSAASSSVPNPRNRKAKRRTVELYDGAYIKRSIGGVTLVPRSPKAYNAQWQSLYDEAIRQERDVREGPDPDGVARYNEAVAKKFQQFRNESKLSISIKDVVQ